MEVKTEKNVILGLIAVLMAIVVWFGADVPAMSEVVSGVFLTAMGGFLGLDIANTLKGSKMKPLKDFQVMKKQRYYIGAVIFILLAGECILAESIQLVDLSISLVMFAGGAMSTLSALLVGLQANSVASKVDGSKVDGSKVVIPSGLAVKVSDTGTEVSSD